ncbi:MAG: radical SAM protein [Pyrinomonadaceae bacterium]
MDGLAKTVVLGTLLADAHEPLLRRDIFTLIERAVDRQLVVNVATNGAIISDRMARRLKQSGVRSMTVSLDGSKAETHDHFRQVPGLFKRTIRAIEQVGARLLSPSTLREWGEAAAYFEKSPTS